MSNVACLLTTLAPLESTTCTGEYILTQADLNTGSVVNTAFATGLDPASETVTSPIDMETATADQQPAISLDKRFDGVSSYDSVGDQITFSYDVATTVMLI